jgi:serine/threonine-protein kinase
MELTVGQTFGDYEILGVLGAGGMGKVYKVRNRITNRVEAMKVLLSGLAMDRELVDRFTREIRIFASLSHPNITELRTALRVDDQFIMIMEFIEGSSLDTLMKQGRIPKEKYLDYMCQALSALSYAHSQGVVHRDIKPANMMLTPSGVLKLMDFGVAKAVTDPQLTKTGLVVGSVYYVSPEQIEGKDVDARADLYSMGVTLYELATGKRPFEGTSDYQIISAHMLGTPTVPSQLDPSLPPDLSDIIMLALQKDPAHRFQTADAFRNALASILAGLRPAAAASPVAAPAPPRPMPAPIPVAAPAPPRPTPMPVAASVSAPAPAKKSNRLLYMLAGSAATIAVIVGAIIGIPKFKQADAAVSVEKPAQKPADKPVDKPVDKPIDKPEAMTPPAAEPAVKTVPPPVQKAQAEPAKPAIKPADAAKPKVEEKLSQPQTQTAQTTPAPPPPQPSPNYPAVPPPTTQTQAPQAPPANAAALAELRERSNLMSVRVATIRGAFQNFQKHQASQGLSPRSDMVAADQRMGYQLDQAEASMQQGDVVNAKKRLDAAERDLEKLESFLGK